MSKKLWLLVVLVAALFVAGCVKEVKEEGECSADSDCSLAGCSGQICAAKDKAAGIITTCEWKDEYSCYTLTSCGCVEGSCKWRETAEFADCVKKFT